MGKRGPEGVDPGTLYSWQHQWFWKFRRLRDGTCDVDQKYLAKDGWEVQRLRGHPGEPEIWEAIKQGQTPDVIVAAFESSKHWISPKSPASMYIADLREAAIELIAAKKDKRYPRSDRPSSDDKRMAFLAAAMAGYSWRVTARTAINLIGTEKLLKEIKAIEALVAKLSDGVFILENKRGDHYGNGVTYWRPNPR